MPVEEKELLRELMHQHFGPENVQFENDHVHISWESAAATVHLPISSFTVESSKADLKARVESAMNRLRTTLYPIPATATSSPNKEK